MCSNRKSWIQAHLTNVPVYVCSYHYRFILQYVNQLVYNAWCVTYFSKEINYIHIKFKLGGLQCGLGQSKFVQRP